MFFNRRLPTYMRSAYTHDSLGGIMHGLFFGLTISFFPIIARKIGASSIQMAFLASTISIGALLTLYWSHVSNKRRKMHFFIFVRALAYISLLFMCLAVKPLTFVVIVLIFWVFFYASDPAYVGIIKDIYPESHRGKATGYVRAERALAAILASYLGGILLDWHSYRIIFPLGAVLGISSLFSYRRIKVVSDNAVETRKKQFSLRDALDIFSQDRKYTRYARNFFIFGVGNLLAIPIYPIFLVDVLQITNAEAGRLAALFSLSCAASFFIWGEHIDRSHPLKTTVFMILLCLAVPICFFAATNLILVAIGTAFSGLAAGAWELSRISYMTGIVTQKSIQSYWGVDTALMGLRGSFVPFLGIALMKLVGMRMVFLISAAVILLGLILMKKYEREEMKLKV